MKLVEPNEETYAIYVNEEDFSMFDLFYSEAGYKTISGQTLDQLASHYGYAIVDKSDKTIGFIETLVCSIYQSKEYRIKDIIKSDENETMSNTEKLPTCPFCCNKSIEILKKGLIRLGDFEISVISQLVKKLRELENDPEIDCYGISELNNVCTEAADTIEALSAKLQAVNMENGSGWILVDENNLPEGEVLGCNIKGSMMVGKIKKVKDGDIRVASFSPFENGMMGCIAYMPLPEPYHP